MGIRAFPRTLFCDLPGSDGDVMEDHKRLVTGNSSGHHDGKKRTLEDAKERLAMGASPVNG